MRISLQIVVPALNEGPVLASCLLDLKPIRQRGAQVVVVDGGSTDTTWLVANARADHVMSAPCGRASQMNAGATWRPAHLTAGGLRQGEPEVLLFLHADTRLPPDADQLIAQFVEQGRLWGRFDVAFTTPGHLTWVAALMNIRSALSGIATGDQAIFVRRDVFEAIGGFADQPLMEDIELSKRLKRMGRPVRIRTTVTTSARRWETQGLWRTIFLMWRLRWAYFMGANPTDLARQYGYRAAPDLACAALAVVAKAPVPGWAKTRLIPQLGAKGAARAHRRLTLNTLHMARHAGMQAVELWCAPDTDHRFFRSLTRSCQLSCRAQPVGDLGKRMRQVFEVHFEQELNLPLLLIGTDCAVLAPAHLQQAAHTLTTHDVVLIPAEDGGYVLIGMRRFLPSVFEDISWSTAQVMAQTRQRLREAQASWKELPILWDVDEPPDWRRLTAMVQVPNQDN